MENHFAKQLCLGSGISFMFLSFLITVPNGFLLVVLYKNPLQCSRKAFPVFLVFIFAVDFFVGIIVCTGETVVRFLCAFSDQNIPRDGNILRVLGYIGINSSILLVTAMSVDRLAAVVFPHFYLRKVKPRKLVFCNTIIIIFSGIFASLQLSGITRDVYRLIDQHLHATFPLCTTTLCYLGIFLVLRKQSSRVVFQGRTALPGNPTLNEMRREKRAQIERKFTTTSFFILLFLILSLIPYFVAIIIAANCESCDKQKWHFAFIESCVVFLFLNSAVNPFVATFRINELKTSVKIVLRLRSRQRENESNVDDFRLRTGTLGTGNQCVST